MHLKNLNLINFKNYSEAEFVFDEGVNCFVGANGSGKTNLLDAIHYLSLCKSYFIADHIGLLPVVMITPVDNILITEGSEERRKLMDSIISQYDRAYLDDLITYNKVLSQRNALLKHFVLHKKFDNASLEIWDDQLIP